MAASDDCDRPHSVVVKNANISYRVNEDRSFGVRELVAQGLRRRASTEVHAVRDVSLDISVGEVFGLVGSNGSGKSSLLRAIAGLQALSSGSIEVRGTTGLLGVNAALKRKLSGHRNVMLGGLAMGLTREEIDAEMEGIVEFSGLGEAMSRPMATYSSGMRARLAFSIATLRVPDVLIIDEALAVGDKAFKERSLARIQEIKAEAGTVVMVSHNLKEITSSCTRVAWLEQGTLKMTGDPQSVVDAYEAQS